ncbi:DUF2334 domain-containing protein [Eubacterium multiforme]|uniref:Peptidoglycan/xylan/chitin deacetylase (PgdA/CDA1 family) n=1 Tax=Eubacterium multiforme TaxID=83339 RepID=A0ABT9UT97_9FIRM|nr:DUF2334 domain-containing protein [Eubacterium multiforme]MDQ0149539.1 peptidoglycan/xylan/chitin deacetylase (PgdA/CDA1 family) [Eubacterium multiforme]
MLFAIRDDDISYFTTIEELERAYDFVKEGTISLSVVPKTVSRHKDDIFPYGKGINDGYYTISDNDRLVDYLRQECKNGRYDILLHGYTHEYKKLDNKWVAEMKWKSKEILQKELMAGKKELENIFSFKIKVFVAPNNSIDDKAISVIEDLKMNYSGIILHGDRKKNFRYFFNYIKRWGTRLIKKIPYPGILDYGKHKELVAYTLDNFERLKYEYECCKKKKVPFVVYTHYWQINDDPIKKKLLKDIYSYVINDGAKLIPLTECFKEEI